MKQNLVQKFRKFYFALPKEEQIALWDIMSAMRGEDSGNDTLKVFTTARIRGALLGISKISFANRALVFASLRKAKSYTNKRNFFEDKREVITLWQQSHYHFKQHIQSAIEALRKHGFKRSISDLMKFI